MLELIPKLSGRLLDCMGAIFLALYAFLVIGPLGVLRGPLAFERFFWYMKVLIPMSMLAKTVRIAIDWRLGHFDVAISQAEEVISHIEDYCQKKELCSIRMRVLGDIYTVLCRSYMHAGHIDEAMQVILRAKKNLGVERLTGLADLDAKSAHLIRAGLAAGKLLDGGGLATMFVKASPKPVEKKQVDDKSNSQKGHRSKKIKLDNGAKIIPFPSNDLLI